MGVKLSIWLLTAKSRESTWFPYMQEKTLDKGYNFVLDLIAIEGLHRKLCAPKVVGVPIVAILGLPLGSPGTKNHLDVALVERCKVYYKGEGGGFPQVRAMVYLVNSSCPWFVLAPKVLQVCTNHFVLLLCRSMWVSEAFHFFLVPFRSSSTPLYPSIVLWIRERAPTLYSSVVFNLGFTFEPFKELKVCQCPNSLLFCCFHLKLTFESIKEFNNELVHIWSTGKIGHYGTCQLIIFHSSMVIHITIWSIHHLH